MTENENKDKKTNKSGGLWALVLAAAAVCVAAFMIYAAPGIKLPLPGGGHHASPTPNKQLTAQIVKEHVLKQCRLVSYTYETEVRVTLTDNVKVPFTDMNMPGCKREITVTVPVTLDMTTDLENMDVDFDASTNAVKIAVPCSRIFRITPNISGISEEAEIGVFRRKMTAEEEKWLIVEAEEEAKRQAEENDMYSAANERAREIITSIVREIGAKYVDISIK